MRDLLLFTWTFCVLAPLGASSSEMPAPADIQIDFARDVEPILKENCYGCHDGAKRTANLRLDTKAWALKGGDYGPVIIPGRSGDSKLIRRLLGTESGLQMPPTGPLSDEEISILRAWIDQGVPWLASSEQTVSATRRPVDPRFHLLIESLRRNDLDAVKAAIEAVPELLKMSDHKGGTPLMYGALFCDVECLRLLLANGADPNAVNSSGATALMWCTHDLRKVQALIDYGADINVASEEGRTPLLAASRNESALGVVQLLLDQQADPNATDARGVTPLMEAATASANRTMELLIAKGADVNLQARNGTTALMQASQSRNTEGVRILLANGAKVNLRRNSGDTALGLAAARGAAGIVQLLVDAHADVELASRRSGYSPLLQAADSEFMNAEVVEILLAAGANASARGKDGESVLELARKRGRTSVVEALMKTGGSE